MQGVSSHSTTASDPGTPTGPPSRSHDAALSTAYLEHAAQMRRYALGILKSPGDAEDLIHDVFIEAWEKWDRYDASRGSLRNWLLVRVRSRAIDRLRAQNRQRRALVSPQPEISEDNPLRAVQAHRAWRALSEAPDRLRQVVELRFGEDLSVSEVAERMRIPVGTVKSRQSHALKMLRSRAESARSAENDCRG